MALFELGKAVLGPLAGKTLSRPISDITNIYGKVASFQALVAKLKGSNASSESGIDKEGSNELTRENYLDVISNRADPALSTEWVAFVSGASATQSSTVNVPWFFIDRFTVPTLSVEASPVYRNGTIKNYAGNISVSGLTLGLYTDISGASISMASEWFSAVFDAQRKFYKPPSSYKRNVLLYLHDPRRRVICEFKFFGCFPTSLSGYQLENSSSTPLETTLELSVDWLSIGTASTS